MTTLIEDADELGISVLVRFAFLEFVYEDADKRGSGMWRANSFLKSRQAKPLEIATKSSGQLVRSSKRFSRTIDVRLNFVGSVGFSWEGCLSCELEFFF